MTVSASSYIHLDQERLTPQHTVCHGVIFTLDHDDLRQLLALKQRGETLTFNDEFRWAWQRYAFLQENNALQTSLSFLLRYEGTDVYKILLGFDGKALCQIAQDLLPSPSLYHQLMEIQGWLLAQLLTQLPWQGKGFLLPLGAWLGAIALVLLSLLLGWPVLMAQPLLLVLLPVVLGLLGWGLQTLFRQWRPSLKRWLLSQILTGYFSRSYGLRSKGIRLLQVL